MKVPLPVKSAVHFFVFSSLFIAVCALVMIYQTNQLLQLNYDHVHYYFFVLFSTLCSYNFHWGLTTSGETPLVRLTWTVQNKKLHYVLFIIGGIGAAVFAIYFLEHWVWLSISIVLTFLYSAPKIPFLRLLRNVAVGKTIFLSMVWMYVTTALPIFISGEHWETADILFCASRFLFIYSICILFDYRDRDFDRREGIRSMITFFDDRGVDRLFYSSLAAFAVVTGLLEVYGFSTSQVVLILIPGAIMLPLYKIAKKNFSDYLYYILLDGMMMLSAILTTIFN
jgi:4-hydroxybenzoate polyprenyltransferase